MGNASSLLIGGLAFSGTIYLLFEESEQLSDQIEDYFGVSPEEDESNDIDAGVRWLLLGAGLTAGYGGYDFSFSLAERVRVAGQHLAARASLLRSPEEELAADDFAVRLIESSGYSVLGADYALSTMGTYAVPLETMTGPARAAFGGLGTDAAGGDAWQYILLGSVHPAPQERRARLQASISTDLEDGVELDLCRDDDAVEVAHCLSWVSAGQSIPAASARLSGIARALAVGDQGLASVECDRLYTALSRSSVSLGLDREIARLALGAALVCPGYDWSNIALPVVETVGGGGYSYLRELSTVLFVANEPSAAYFVADRLSAKASNNAVAYADFTRWSTSLGLYDLARASVAACSTGSQNYVTADSGAFCRDIFERSLADAPTHSQTVWGQGLSLRQRLVALWHVQFLRDALNQLPDDEQRLRLIRFVLRTSSMDEWEVREETERWCFRPNEFGANIVILTTEEPLVHWRAANSSCLASELLDRPVTNLHTPPSEAGRQEASMSLVTPEPTTSAVASRDVLE